MNLGPYSEGPKFIMDFYSKLLQKNAYGYDVSGLVKDDGAFPGSATNGASGDQKNYPGAEMNDNDQEALVNQHEKEHPKKNIRPRSN